MGGFLGQVQRGRARGVTKGKVRACRGGVVDRLVADGGGGWGAGGAGGFDAPRVRPAAVQSGADAVAPAQAATGLPQQGYWRQGMALRRRLMPG